MPSDTQNMEVKHAKAINRVINDYMVGIYQGNVEQLRSSFSPEAYLFGDVNAVEYRKSLEDYLSGVAGRQSPEQLGETMRMKLLGLEIQGQVAVARVHMPMLGFNYYDFLSLSIVKGEWKIVNKIFTHVE